MDLDLTSLNWAAIAPIAVALVALVGYCLVDIVRGDVKYLPKWAWALICVVSVPAGAIIYLIVGRETESRR